MAWAKLVRVGGGANISGPHSQSETTLGNSNIYTDLSVQQLWIMTYSITILHPHCLLLTDGFWSRIRGSHILLTECSCMSRLESPNKRPIVENRHQYWVNSNDVDVFGSRSPKRTDSMSEAIQPDGNSMCLCAQSGCSCSLASYQHGWFTGRFCPFAFQNRLIPLLPSPISKSTFVAGNRSTLRDLVAYLIVLFTIQSGSCDHLGRTNAVLLIKGWSIPS